MLFSLSTLVAFGLALSPIASALPAPGTTVTKREVFNLPNPTMFMECGTGYRWARPEILAAVQRGMNSGDNTVANNFPHNYGNNQRLAMNPACAGRTLKEYPLLENNVVFDGSQTWGLHRVVYSPYGIGEPNDRDGTFCAVITHQGAAQNAFNPCNVVD